METDPWPILDSETEYGNPYFDVKRLNVELPSGKPNDYYRMEPRSEAAIAVATCDGQLVLVELYRPRLGRRVVEFPGGGIDEEETPEKAALREFSEETGYEADRTEYVGSFYHSPWNIAEQHVVWLRGVERGEFSCEDREEEVQSVIEIPPERVLDRVLSSPVPSWCVTPLLLVRQAGLLDADLFDI